MKDTRLHAQSEAASSNSFTPYHGTGLLQRSRADVPPIVHEVLRSPGQALDEQTRAFLEPRLGHYFGKTQVHSSSTPVTSGSPASLTIGSPHDRSEREADAIAAGISGRPPVSTSESLDLSHVRIHTDARAGASAGAINAYAYTVGNNVVFGSGQYRPHTERGLKLLAHELTHVVQQGTVAQPGMVRRSGMGDVRLAEAIANLENKIRTTPAFSALDADSLLLAEEIFTLIHSRPRNDQLYLLLKLQPIFDTRVATPEEISIEFQTATTSAAEEEKKRIAKPAQARNVNIEEKAAGDPKRRPNWLPIAGKFGGGTYYVDRTAATDIVVRAEILLTATGTGTKKDIDEIKSMEDAIEKAASTKGYLVDISFVDVGGADTFKVNVDPSQWETATNWSGGAPWGFAHELHHLFAFTLDRYDYMLDQADNKSMLIPARLYWFLQELKKPAGHNDPTSIMAKAPHPNERDVCLVAGLDVATCVAARAAAARPRPKR